MASLDSFLWCVKEVQVNRFNQEQADWNKLGVGWSICLMEDNDNSRVEGTRVL